MLSLANLTIEELRMIANTKDLDGYQYTSRQPLENILTKPSSSILPSSSIQLDHKPKIINNAFVGNCVKSRSKKSITEYLEKIRPHIGDLVNHLKKFNE